MPKIYPAWKRRSVIGNKPITQLEGINSIAVGRLSEEGIDYIEQMALCVVDKIHSKTKYPIGLIRDWKEQAIL